MRRDWREPKPSRMFRGSELPRLLAGLLMLALLLLLFNRLRNPDMWTWFAPNAPSSTAAGKTEDAKGSPTAAAIRAATDEPQSTPRSTGQTREKTPSESPPPRDLDKEATDQDPDEAREAAMEYQAITDGTLELQREEMVPYNRIVRWVQNQSFDTLLHRARSDLIFRQLYQSPDKYRGKLVALDLNVRQVLDVGESENGVQLWEVVGWTTESNAWLYWTIVLDLPKGMPTGPNVSERARFVGYLFKLQGYHEAGAKPNAPPLKRAAVDRAIGMEAGRSRGVWRHGFGNHVGAGIARRRRALDRLAIRVWCAAAETADDGRSSARSEHRNGRADRNMARPSRA